MHHAAGFPVVHLDVVADLDELGQLGPGRPFGRRRAGRRAAAFGNHRRLGVDHHLQFLSAGLDGERIAGNGRDRPARRLVLRLRGGDGDPTEQREDRAEYNETSHKVLLPKARDAE